MVRRRAMLANRIARSLPAMVAALAVSLAGCPESKPETAKPGPAPAEAQKVSIAVLVTADELGWLLPSAGEGGQKKGGAAELLGQWVNEEKHCPGGTACKAGYDATVAL